jgi:hypothetical protein
VTADTDAAVTGVLRRYGSFLDRGRFDDWLALFTDDAVCGSGSQTYEGIDAIGRWIRQKTAFGQHAISTPLLHYSSGGTAVTAVIPFSHVMVDDDGNGHLERAGRYFTRLRLVDGQWRIVEHIIDFHVFDQG